jgi:polar amino acid transport system substrate-binding protein
MPRTQKHRGKSAVGRLALVSVFGVHLALLACKDTGADRVGSNGSTPGAAGFLDRIASTGELHAGYGVYPPYTMEDPNTRAVSGFSVELMEAIGKELNAKVVWHRLNWNTMSADLQRGTYDVIADPIFHTIPRAREFTFTEPYAWFADGIAVVKLEDGRFSDFASLDQPGITVAVGQGWASETLVKNRFTRARVVSVPTTTDLLQVFNEVISGRADVAVADAADAQRFVDEHASEVKALFMDNPPAYMPAGFALRRQDDEGAEFLDVALRYLEAVGTLDALATKYKVVTAPNR